MDEIFGYIHDYYQGIRDYKSRKEKRHIFNDQDHKTSENHFVEKVTK